MITVFLSHSSRDKDLARRIATDLKNHSIEVWFDEWKIHVGHSISKMIGQGLEKADFVAVLLTEHSVGSGWVDKEWQAKIGEEATNRKVIILPLLGEDCCIPALLRDKRYANFVKSYKSGLDELLIAIETHSGEIIPGLRSKMALRVERMANLAIGGIPLPCFFPSISGAAKNAMSALKHLEILTAMGYPHFLISAYDIFHATRKDRLNIQSLLDKATSKGQVILMDSGLYEKKWLRDKNWPKTKFHEILRSTPCHLAFCYDNPNPKGNTDQIALALARSVVTDQKKSDMNVINPLIHAQKPEDFPRICSLVANELDPAMLAVPERELGDGILSIAKTLRTIRKTLNETGRYYPVHIVGTGNPLSILIYTACGADSFDGLDWCQTVVDHETGRLYHSLQLDFFAHQTTYGSDTKLAYLPRMLAHNLMFYLGWMEKIRKTIKEGSMAGMIEEFIPTEAHSKLQKLLPDNYK